MSKTRKCGSCQNDLPLSSFNFKNKKLSTFQSYCRSCANKAWREWYAKPRNKARHLEALRQRRKRRTARNKSVVEKLKSSPCADCHQVFPVEAMDFDHLYDKEALISKLVYTAGTERLLAEISKCEVVCSNCHRIRTAERLRSRVSKMAAEN